MIHFLSVFVAVLMLCCVPGRPPSPAEVARGPALILGPNAYCGAALISPSRAVTAKHCVDDGICGTATDQHGNSVRCEVESMGSEGYDVAFIRVAPGLQADPMPIGSFTPGPVDLVTFKPMPFSYKRLDASFSLTGREEVQGTEFRHIIQVSGILIPGESGSPVIQNGRIVAVVTASNPGELRAYVTSLR